MMIPVLLVRYLLPLDIYTTTGALLTVGICAIVGAPIYIGLSYKMGIVEDLFGKNIFKKLLHKISFGKLGNK